MRMVFGSKYCVSKLNHVYATAFPGMLLLPTIYTTALCTRSSSSNTHRNTSPSKPQSTNPPPPWRFNAYSTCYCGCSSGQTNVLGGLILSTARGLPIAAAASQDKQATNALHPGPHFKHQQLSQQQQAPDNNGTLMQPDGCGQAWEQLLQLLQMQPAQQARRGRELPQSLQAALSSCAKETASLPAAQLLQLLVVAGQLQLVVPGPQHQLVSVLTATAISSLQQLHPQQLADALCSLQALHAAYNSAQAAAAGAEKPGAAGSVMRSDQSQAQHTYQLGTHEAALSRAVRTYLQQQQHKMDAGSTAAVAAALAACKQSDSFPVLAMLALEHMQDMLGSHLVQLLTAFADAQHYNQAVCDAAAQRAVGLIKQQGLKVQQLQQPAAAVKAPQQAPTAAAPASPAATSKAVQPSQASDVATGAQAEVTGGCVSAVTHTQGKLQQGGSFTADALVSLLEALARLRHYDPPLLEASCTCLLRSPQRSLSEVVSLVHTCAVLNHYHAQLFDAAVDLALQALQQQQQQPCQSVSSSLPRLLAVLCWCCASTSHWDRGFLQQLFAWSDKLDATQLPTGELLLWFEVQSGLRDVALLKLQQSPDGLSSHLVAAAQRAWAVSQQSRRPTAFQKEVVEALQQAGVRYRLNLALDGPVVVDVALQQRQVGARYRVALQLHPHEDFAANPPHGALGPTAARWRALQARGWRVVTLRQSEWRHLQTKQQQVEYAWHLSQGVEVSAPGMPHVVHQVVVGKPAAPKPSLPQTLLRILLEGH